MRSFLKLFRENLRISISAIRSNLLRTILTVFIIAFGIMALVGILTAIEAITRSITDQFVSMGANTFTIVNRNRRINRESNFKSIEYREALEFKGKFNFPSVVSLSTYASGTATVKFKSVKTNPNIPVMGVDENYIYTSGREISRGRNFNSMEIQSYSHNVVIGKLLADELFDERENPIGNIINIGSGKYRIIGVLQEKGASFGSDEDKICLIPITSVRQYFSRPDMNYRIHVLPRNPELIKAGLNEAEGIFRVIRKVRLGDESDFIIESSDSLVNILLKDIKNITWAATIIGIITLFGAAIGLMNIMLVSVTERTREIGIRKAIGAKSSVIRQQFLYESVLIGQIGGVFGVILGILVGNIVSLVTGGNFIIPWVWIISGVLLCLVVGLVSGLFPAIKASKLDPIVSLRYE